MGLVRRRFLAGLGFAALSAAALPAFAVEATLVADAHVNSARPGVNSGGISNLNVGGGYTALLQFDLSTLPAGTTSAQISRATLRLYCNRVDTAGSVSLQPVNRAWGESTVTFATLPLLGTAAQTVSVSQAGAYVAVDVTALVQGWVIAPATNNGVALTSGAAVVQFDSKENDLTGHAAVLDVALVSSGSGGVAGPQGPVGPQGATGPKGDAGAPGPAGPQGAPGAAGLNYQGEYAAGVSYALHDVVTFGGSSYVSLAGGNEANTPGVSGQWAVLAQGGASGSGGGAGVAYQGTYAATANYGLNDVVSYQGSSYISLMAGNVGNTPNASPGQWGVLALGAVGIQGPQGLMGPVGPSGLSGSPGPAGVAGPAGATGATGAVGAQGPAGAQGAPGPAVANFRGSYSATTNYGLHDAASFGGSTYVSLVSANLGNAPDASPAQWAVLVAQGPAGSQGPQGSAGATGATGAVGATGPSGPAGPPASFQGAWQLSTSYAVGAVVGFRGASYVALTANVGRQPDATPTFWAVLAQAGTAGAPGAAGPQGPAGAPGSVGVTYRGTWLPATTYHANDVVAFNGATYLGTTSSLGSEPDVSPPFWAVLALNGVTGATGPGGTAATVSVGTVTTGAAGSQASVTNAGTANAAVLNFTIPQGAAGTGGGTGGGGETSGIPFASLYHAVSFNFSFYSVNSANSAATEADSV
ncbi:MAG TPA: DNRLRE domain-containing protein, partial [Edaphobacter sp.]|nr:DNRLRE domain-containing protein [Edaphobacter sp.]